MHNESDVEIISSSVNLKKTIGYAYITGYSLGTLLGILAPTHNSRLDNITRYNNFFGNAFATASTLCGISVIAYIKFLNQQ